MFGTLRQTGLSLTRAVDRLTQSLSSSRRFFRLSSRIGVHFCLCLLLRPVPLPYSLQPQITVPWGRACADAVDDVLRELGGFNEAGRLGSSADLGGEFNEAAAIEELGREFDEDAEAAAAARDSDGSSDDEGGSSSGDDSSSDDESGRRKKFFPGTKKGAQRAEKKVFSRKTPADPTFTAEDIEALGAGWMFENAADISQKQFAEAVQELVGSVLADGLSSRPAQLQKLFQDLRAPSTTPTSFQVLQGLEKDFRELCAQKKFEEMQRSFPRRQELARAALRAAQETALRAARSYSTAPGSSSSLPAAASASAAATTAPSTATVPPAARVLQAVSDVLLKHEKAVDGRGGGFQDRAGSLTAEQLSERREIFVRSGKLPLKASVQKATASKTRKKANKTRKGLTAKKKPTAPSPVDEESDVDEESEAAEKRRPHLVTKVGADGLTTRPLALVV